MDDKIAKVYKQTLKRAQGLEGASLFRMLAKHDIPDGLWSGGYWYTLSKEALRECYASVFEVYAEQFYHEGGLVSQEAKVVMAMAIHFHESEQDMPELLKRDMLRVLVSMYNAAMVEDVRAVVAAGLEGVEDVLMDYPVFTGEPEDKNRLTHWFFRDTLRAAVVDLVPETDRILAGAMETYEGYKSKYAEDTIVRSASKFPAQCLVRMVSDYWKDDGSRDAALGVLKALHLSEAGDVAPLYVKALLHKSKPVRERAEGYLLKLGEDARQAVEAHGVKAKKKAAREASARILEALALAESDDHVEVSDEARERYTALLGSDYVNVLLNQAQNDKQRQCLAELTAVLESEFRPFIEFVFEKSAEPGVYRASSYINHFMMHVGDEHRTWFWERLFAIQGMWSKKLRAYEKRDYKRKLKARFPAEGVDLEQVLAPVLVGMPMKAYGEVLFDFYYERSKAVSFDVVEEGLKSSAKAVRELSVKQCESGVGEDDLKRLVTLVKKGKAAERLAAAQALEHQSEALLAGVAGELTDIHASEKSQDVLDVMDRVMRKVGSGGADVPPEEVFEEDASVDVLEELLCQQRVKKMPAYIDVEKLPDLLWASSGKALSSNALRGLLSVLRNEGPDFEEPVARQVRPYLDDASAHQWSVALKEQWKTAGSKSTGKWCAYQQAIFVGEERLNEFAPHLADWVSAGKRFWAQWYLDILARHGSVTGQSWIMYWSLNAVHKSLKNHAKDLLKQLRESFDGTDDEFRASMNLYVYEDAVERQFDTLGLEKGVILALDKGETCEAVIGPDFEIMIKRKGGKLQKSLPKSATPEAKDTFSTLQRRFKYLKGEMLSYLENAMISGRPWTKEQFEALFMRHPVASKFAESLLFVMGDGELFHVNEGDIMTVDWDEQVLADDVTIKLAHVYDLKDRDVSKWLAHMGDGGVVQPFAQLDRPLYGRGNEPSLGEVSAATLAGRLGRSGWRNAPAEDAGMVYEASMILPGRGVKVYICHNGFYIGDPSWSKDATKVEVSYFESLTGERVSADKVDPVAYSETWLGLERLVNG